MMGRFLGQFGRSPTVAPIMRTDNFPVNFYPRLSRERLKSLNESNVKNVKSNFSEFGHFLSRKV
jgi:hypothetical protein